ncbi:MAG: LuxR C-terminal-related transcriptional regulator [Gemmatimonadaceae bacterium]
MAKKTCIRVLFLQDRDEVATTPDLAGEDLTILQERADTADSIAATLLRLEPNVIVAPATSESSALETLRISQELCPAAPVILIVDSIDESAAVVAVRAGAEGLVLRNNMHRLRTVIDRALEVRKPVTTLSRRQIEVLRLVASGNTTRVIAENLGLSVKTIESHRTALMKRLGVHDVTALVRFAVRVGFAQGYEA